MVVPQKTAIEVICQRVAAGDTLAEISGTLGMPCIATIAKWRRSLPEFADALQLAREARAMRMADELERISDEAGVVREVRYEPDGSWTEHLAYDATKVAADRVRIDTRKWLAARYLPAIYGERVQADVSGTVEHTMRLVMGETPAERARRLADDARTVEGGPA